MTANVAEVKIVLFGDVSVGKTALINRWVRNEYHAYTVATVGAQFATKSTADFKYQCWDTSGQEKYRSLLPMYWRSAQIGVLVFDVGNRSSYLGLPALIEIAKKHCPKTTQFILVGNKCDKQQENRHVTTEEAQAFAKENQMTYCEVSPLLSVGMDTFEQHIVNLSQPIEITPKAMMLQKIDDFAQSRPNNQQVQNITRILRAGLNTSDPRAYYEHHQDELVENYQALRWTSKSLLNSALNLILTVFAKCGLHFSGVLARNQNVRGYPDMFYAFGAKQEMQVLEHEIDKYLTLTPTA